MCVFCVIVSALLMLVPNLNRLKCIMESVFVTFFIGNVDVDEVLIRGASVKIQERIQVKGESNS